MPGFDKLLVVKTTFCGWTERIDSVNIPKYIRFMDQEIEKKNICVPLLYRNPQIFVKLGWPYNDFLVFLLLSLTFN